MSLFTESDLKGGAGAYITQSLFYETRDAQFTPLMTLTEEDKIFEGKVLPSLRKIYMEESDPTEYNVAMRVFGSWRLWTKLCGNKKVMQYIQSYRDELEVKLRSEAVKALMETATQDGAKGTSAAKYIAEKGWDKRKAGAPSKAEVKGQMNVLTGIDKEIQDDFERLELTH